MVEPSIARTEPDLGVVFPVLDRKSPAPPAASSLGVREHAAWEPPDVFVIRGKEFTLSAVLPSFVLYPPPTDTLTGLEGGCRTSGLRHFAVRLFFPKVYS
jgi:hypothetical protein